MKKGFSALLTMLLVVVFLGIASGAYYLGSRNSLRGVLPIPTPTTTLPPPPPLAQPVVQKAAEPLFSGSVKKINKDLGIFKITDMDKENNILESIVYYEAGMYLRGDYKGYTRVLAIRPSEGPGPSLQFILATKDYNSYVLDDPNSKTTNFPEDDWDNPYMFLDKSKISKAVALDTDHPSSLEVGSPFKLIRQDSVLIESVELGQKNKSGYDIYVDAPITDFEKSLQLTSSQSQLSLYTGGTDWSNVQPQDEKEKTALATRKKYLNKTTLVHGVDSTGLAYSYILSTEKDSAAYENNLASEEQKLITYKKQVVLYNEKKLKDYPTYPETMPFPGMRLTKTSAGLPADYYSTYDSAFPGACGGNRDTYVIDSLTDADLSPVTSSSVYPLFVLKDSTHPLYELAYETKTQQGEESFKGVNDGKSMPTYVSFVAKHPLVFFKDAWGRWATMGEFDLKLMGGCGKPVVYLYPEKQTTVHVSFASPVALNTQIPTYNNGWLVSANPNGMLTDLQPRYTDCSKIDTAKFGSEYAGTACKTNAYPYIYWTGKSVENSYPKAEGGWIVTKENLSSFMQGKLSEMGLTEREAGDMIAYWVPKMSDKNTPYYKISFLQTKDMNAFVPMNVNPMPDSVLRVFLDWKALSSEPVVDLKPQVLEKASRNGFTLVEWGGLQ